MRRGATPTAKAGQATIAIADHRRALAGLHSVLWGSCPARAAGHLPTVAQRVPQGLRQSAQAVPVTVASLIATVMASDVNEGEYSAPSYDAGSGWIDADSLRWVIHAEFDRYTQ